MERLNLHALVVSLCVALATQIVSANVWADDLSQVPPPLFETRFTKEGDPAATTSKCIGNPITPLCAVDTYYADFFYKDDHLREIAYGKRSPTQKLITPPPYKPNFSCYQIVGYWAYQKEDRIYETRSFIKPGDVAIMVRWGAQKQTANGTLVAGECNLQPNGYPFHSFILREGQCGWYIYGDSHMVDYVHDPEPYHLWKLGRHTEAVCAPP